jgi:hypothetical protein
MILKKKHLSNKARSRRSESRGSKSVNARLQPASGALPVAAFKGDYKNETFLFDDKTTNAQSYSVGVKLWRKHAKDAFVMNRKPALRIEFTDGPTLFVIDESMFRRLTNQD